MGNLTGKKLHRCKAETSITCNDPEFGRVMGPGQTVDLEETIGTDKKGRAVKLGELVRAGCFEELEAELELEPINAELVEAEAQEGAELETKTPKPKTRGTK